MAKSVMYNVCIARPYKKDGQDRVHFWTVGKAFAFETTKGERGIAIDLWSKTLETDKLTLFEDRGAERLAQSIRDRPNQQQEDTPEDDDIPF